MGKPWFARLAWIGLATASQGLEPTSYDILSTVKGGISFVRVSRRSNASLSLVLALQALPIGGCGGNVANDAARTASTISTGGSSAVSVVGGASSTAGAAATAAGSTSAPPDTIHSILQNSVGQFFVRIREPNKLDSMPGYTDAIGAVRTAADPSLYVQTPVASEIGCTLYRWSVPACTNTNNGAGCEVSTQICTANDTCTPYPSRIGVGDVTVTGVSTTSGATSFALALSDDIYFTSGDVSLVYPGVTEGEAISISATGGSVPAFEISAKGIRPLVLDASSYVLPSAGAFTVTWAPPGAASDARVQLVLRVQRYILKGQIACDVADTGSLTISANLISSLIALGVGGYPELTVTRRSLGTTTIANGQVVLSVESSVSPTLSIEGYTSCSGDFDCSAGQTCNTSVKVCQ